MPQGVRGFIGSRLTEARLVRGIASSRALADLIGRAPSTVGRWELQESSPEPAALREIAKTLRLPEAFFLESRFSECGTVFFRSLAAAFKVSRSLQSGRLLWLADVAEVADHYAHLPAVDVPDLLKGGSYKDLRQEDIEGAAKHLRDHWGLGLKPIDNMITLMEGKGIIVASEFMDTDRLDGLGSWVNGRPYVLLASDKASYARRQFDAAHELAHLVLHRAVTEHELTSNHKLIESQANGFASAFLLPADQYPLEVQNVDLFELERLKVRWKTSMKAQIYRLRTLSVLSEDTAAGLFKRYSAKGYSKGEPYDQGAWPLQEPSILADVFREVINQGMLTKSELIQEFCLSPNDVESLSGLPTNWFRQETARVIELRPRQTSSEVSVESDNVVPLERK
jgi:Zn-dependent peptidase ImmA (M78 family)/transcriptional regulator with XRE-family HTH domain